MLSLTRSGYISVLVAALLLFLEANLLIAIKASSDTHPFMFTFGLIFATLIFLVAWRLIKDLTGGDWGDDSADSKPFSLTGLSLTEEQAPELWQFIQATAAKAGSAMPDHLVLGLGGQLTLVRDQVQLTSGDKLPPGNLLYLPLTVLAYLPKAEAEALIAAALFDLIPAENDFRAEFRVIFKQLGQIIRAGEIHMRNLHLEEDKPGSMAINLIPAAYFLQTFINAARQLKPDHYFQADRLGAAVAGSENLVRALLRLRFLSPLVNQALAEAWHGDARAESGLLPRISRLLREKKTPPAVEELLANPFPICSENLLTPAQIYLNEGLGLQPTDAVGGLPPSERDSWKVYDVLDDPLWPAKLRPSLDSRLKELGVEVTPGLISEITEDDGSSLLGELGLRRGKGKDDSSTADLITLIEKDFEATARRSLEAEQAYLNRLLSQGAEKQEYSEYDHSGHRGRLVLAAIGCGAMGIPLGLTENILFLLAAVAAFTIYYFWLSGVKRKSKPYLTVTDTSLTFNRFLLEMPWTVIDYFAVENHLFRNTIIIHTLSAYEFSGAANKRLQWDSSQNKLTIKGVPSHLAAYDINSKAWPAFKNMLARGELDRRLREYGRPRWAAGSDCGKDPG